MIDAFAARERAIDESTAQFKSGEAAALKREDIPPKNAGSPPRGQKTRSRPARRGATGPGRRFSQEQAIDYPERGRRGCRHRGRDRLLAVAKPSPSDPQITGPGVNPKAGRARNPAAPTPKPQNTEPQFIRTLTVHTAPVESVAFSPDGRLLASGSDDLTIKIWDPANWRDLRTLSGHNHEVYAVAFSPDGRLLALGSRDETIKLWDRASGQMLRTLTGHSNTVFTVAFPPTGRFWPQEAVTK